MHNAHYIVVNAMSPKGAYECVDDYLTNNDTSPADYYTICGSVSDTDFVDITRDGKRMISPHTTIASLNRDFRDILCDAPRIAAGLQLCRKLGTGLYSRPFDWIDLRSFAEYMPERKQHGDDVFNILKHSYLYRQFTKVGVTNLSISDDMRTQQNLSTFVVFVDFHS